MEPRPLIRKTTLTLPLAGSDVSAGFPSPADDFLEAGLDLNEQLIRHPAASFIVRVSGNSMTRAGIFPGDLLIVDRSLQAGNGQVVIASVDGELTVKRLCLVHGVWQLVPENRHFPVITLSGDSELQIWGVVTAVIRELVRG